MDAIGYNVVSKSPDFLSKLYVISCNQLSFKILLLVKEKLSNIAIVCKAWKEMAYHPTLYEMIVPTERFGEHKWQACFGVKTKETLLPLCIFQEKYSNMIKSGAYLVWVPDEVKNLDNSSIKIDIFSIAKLSANLIDENPLISVIDINRGISLIPPTCIKLKCDSKAHWVLINNKTISGETGNNATLSKAELKIQNKIIAEEGPGAHISGELDTLVTMFAIKALNRITPFAIGTFGITCLRVDMKTTELSDSSSVKKNNDFFRELMSWDKSIQIDTSITSIFINNNPSYLAITDRALGQTFTHLARTSKGRSLPPIKNNV